MTETTAWMSQFDGGELDSKTHVSALLATVDAGGRPHIAYLSCGEILALPPDRLRLLLWPASGTARNLKVSRSASLHIAHDGVVQELGLETVCLLADEQSFMIEMQVVGSKSHRAPYASVRGMIDFELSDPAATLDRWRDQIARLRGFVGTESAAG